MRSALVLAVFALALPEPALAWSNHERATALALQAMPEVASAAPVAVEPLSDFLRAEEPRIAAVLAEHETWGATHFENYPARPAALAFVVQADRDDAARQLAFVHALRIAADHAFETPAGGPVAALAVIAAAADEPDKGVDINCWDDSQGAWGKTYGFGPMPFGNPALSFATQAPFHMGLYHETLLFTLVDPALKRNYPALRFHQFATLASLAFRTHHDYWGWRFSGLALHYIQDGTQPYHARIVPGLSFLTVVADHILAMAGHPAGEHDLTVFVSNRHLVLEGFATQLLASEQGAALRDALERTTDDGKYPAWSDRALEDVVTAETAAAADHIADAVVAAMPAHLVLDPRYDFGASNDSVDFLAVMANAPPAARAALTQAVIDLYAHFGAHSRRALRSILSNGRAG